jgi:3-(methylthio)propionyl---CoA ligase
MLGLMQNQPLLISNLIEFAARHHGDAQIVSRRIEGDIHRCTYADAAARARQVAGALDRLGLAFSDRVGTLAWNGYRHFELYFGVSGSGRVVHTINPRLAPEQVAWIANHAEDKVLCFDMTFLPIIKAIWSKCETVKHWIALCDANALPADTGIAGLRSYEEWIAGESKQYTWPQFDENSASALCYTSGTTGNPKGVLYSHRSTTLHAYAGALPDALDFSARDTILPVVPMFHVNAWGIPYGAAMTGMKIVFPGAALDGKSVYELMEAERVTVSAGVPTVWLMLLNHMKAGGLGFSTMKRTVIGGSACPPAMITSFRDDYGVTVLHAWGMTEMSPLGTVCNLKLKHLAADKDAQLAVQIKQGRAVFGVELKIVDPAGRELPWDGTSSGDLLVKGPWILSSYFKGEHRRRRFRCDHRPQQGRHQVRRRVDQLDRHREHRDGAPGGGDGRLHRRAASEVGRAAAARRGQEAWRRCHARGAAGPLRRQGRQVASARRRGLRRCDSARRHRQDAEEQAARAVRQRSAGVVPVRSRRCLPLTSRRCCSQTQETRP